MVEVLNKAQGKCNVLNRWEVQLKEIYFVFKESGYL